MREGRGASEEVSRSILGRDASVGEEVSVDERLAEKAPEG